MKHAEAHPPSKPEDGTGKGIGLADLCIRRPVFATMINLFLVVLGWFSFKEIGVDQFPNVELPVITVTTTLRGASPEEMETSVTKPLEEIINTIQGRIEAPPYQCQQLTATWGLPPAEFESQRLLKLTGDCYQKLTTNSD